MLYPAGVPLNKSTMFRGNSLCLTLYMKMAIFCSRMLYRGNELARLRGSSHKKPPQVPFQLLVLVSFFPLLYKSSRQGYNRSDAVISLFYKFAVLPQ